MDKQDCLFCNISKGKMNAATIFENSEFKVILDRFPAAKGHTLIIPKEHVENIFELDSETAAKLFALATHIAKVLKNVIKCDGMNVLQNNGKVAGQTVFHFHLHLIPRFEDDNVNFKWKTMQFTEEQLDEIALQLSKDI